MQVEVTRGDLVESLHEVHLCAATPSGEVALRSGDIESPVFLRSTAKPFIAAAVLAAGARERFDLTMPEIAVMSASHMGEPFHVDAVRAILAKIGMDESALLCGPQDERSPDPVYNNCSGKHAGILALCTILGADPAGYREAGHPAETAILDFCARLSGDDAAAWPLGVDGCGIPVYATSLRKAAMAFARFASLTELAPRDAMALLAVRDAMVSYPAYVSGTHEFDTRLMAAAGGAVACKVGAEGVHGVALIPQGLGIASKVLDGTGRARPPATMAALRALAVPVAEAADLRGFAHPTVYNRAGRAVGSIRVAPGFAVEQAS